MVSTFVKFTVVDPSDLDYEQEIYINRTRVLGFTPYNDGLTLINMDGTDSTVLVTESMEEVLEILEAGPSVEYIQ